MIKTLNKLGIEGNQLSGDRVLAVQDEKGSGDGWQEWLHNNVNVLNATELDNFKWLK